MTAETDLVSDADSLMRDLLVQARERENRENTDLRLQVMAAATKWLSVKKSLPDPEEEHTFDRFRERVGDPPPAGGDGAVGKNPARSAKPRAAKPPSA